MKHSGVEDGQWVERETELTPVHITKKANDPDNLVRISIGGKPDIGYYLLYRGTKEEAIVAIRRSLKVLENMSARLGNGELPVSSDNGKKYA